MSNVQFTWSLDRSSDVGRALLAASRRLREAGSDTPQLDSAVLMAHVLGVSKTWLYAHPDRHLTEEEITRFEQLVQRRMRHEPVAYLVGYKSFFGLDITVTPAVLIPRPETELLVERVLAHARFLIGQGLTPRIADVGTGSGAIAVALAVNLPQAIIYATDVSEQALAVAGQNVWRYGVGEQVQLLPGYLLEPLPGPVEIIVANLPYVASADLADLPRRPAPPPTSPNVGGIKGGWGDGRPGGPVGAEVRDYEPLLALDGGPDGLDVIRALFDSLAPGGSAHGKLAPGGRIYLEIGAGQGAQVSAIARQALPTARIELAADYADLDRLVVVATS